jgi:predicted TIM-barrel fold metal-dependent hydrolase
VTTAVLDGVPRDEVWPGSVIDCDVHANVPSLEALFPYMDRHWIDWCTERGWHGPVGGVALSYPPGSDRTCRPRWRPADVPPASDVGLLREHVLDPWRVERAIVNCYYAVDALRHPDWAAALARAVNDWLIAEWLDRDPRLAASLVVPARDPAAMIEEIRRVGGHPGFVQVLLPVRSAILWGQRLFHPVFTAMVEHDLVAGLHYGGITNDAPSSTGYASSYLEEYAAEWQAFTSQVTSLVSEGVFQVCPDLRVSVLEGGFAWLPVWGWRMNKEWKGLRREVPWLDRLPLDVIRDHMRFSVAPTDAGPPEQLATVLRWLGSEDLLMFATDYPHGYDDDVRDLLAAAPPTMRPKIMSETARAWYRL